MATNGVFRIAFCLCIQGSLTFCFCFFDMVSYAEGAQIEARGCMGRRIGSGPGQRGLDGNGSAIAFMHNGQRRSHAEQTEVASQYNAYEFQTRVELESKLPQ